MEVSLNPQKLLEVQKPQFFSVNRQNMSKTTFNPSDFQLNQKVNKKLFSNFPISFNPTPFFSPRSMKIVSIYTIPSFFFPLHFDCDKVSQFQRHFSASFQHWKSETKRKKSKSEIAPSES
jgi:hypothetical protein